jgi:allophanate hydrolase subunit 1
MSRTEGIPALYDGRRGELLKAVLNHGTAMLSEEFVRKLVVQLYFLIP